MRYRLQYLYSIVVFFGVLACSYFMVSRETTPGIPFRTIEAPPMRAEASPLDPGVNQLFEAERAIKKQKRDRLGEEGTVRSLTKSPDTADEE